MAENLLTSSAPVPDKVLRDLARNVAKALPNFVERDPTSGVKELHAIISPVLETADLPDLESSHRAAASNALCAIIEKCQATGIDYVHNALLDDSIWFRLFNIYLQRSDDAKGKSMRQLLLVLATVVAKDQSNRAFQLRKQATITFLDIICQRQDRLKVKPALQGLAHFLLRDVVSIAQLVELFGDLQQRYSIEKTNVATPKSIFRAFLAWIVHHDTALSAGHLIRNFLLQARRLPTAGPQSHDTAFLPLWIEPVVQTLQKWPDRIQEFKTHVFPHCFLPNIDEYIHFLSYLHFDKHVQPKGTLPDQLSASNPLPSGLNEPEEFNILLAAFETGKELSIIRDIDHRTCENVEIHDGAVHIPDIVFGGWMSHPEPEVRLAGMFLSVYSASVTRPFTGGVFKSLQRNLVHMHTDTDANFRRGVHGCTQKLFDRLRASTATLAKGTSKRSTSIESRLPFPKNYSSYGTLSRKNSRQDPLTEALAFVVWYMRFLEWEMRSTASYQRRVTALRTLTIVLRSGVDSGVPQTHLSKSAQGQLNWAHSLQIANPKLIRVLFDLILDPFDDIRDSAISVLQLCLIALPQAQKDAVLATIPRFMSRAETAMLRTGRADQADGVARAYGLIFSLAGEGRMDLHGTQLSSKLAVFEHLKRQLDSTLDIAHNNLSEAVNGRPVHGIYAAFRYIVDQHDFYAGLSSAPTETLEMWKQLHKDVLGSIELLWSYVYHVLCADAPEGLIPDEMEDETSLDTKEILSYSWRGLKEASTLLRTVITTGPIGHDDGSIITPELFEKLGRLCFVQLLELRHRGAFSTVSQTFAAFCRRCVSSNIPLLRALPETWYQETLESIQEKAGAITRRSAGIPALMSGILAAEPQVGSKLFPRAMRDLVTEASVEAKSENIEESRLPQVHALNCIKEIFTTSKLSVASEPYIGQALELAAKTLNSNIWPIRNCSLMLFKALIERLLGSDEAQDWKENERTKTSRFSFDNYPSLVNILSDLLDPSGPLKQSIESTPDSSSPLDLHGAEGVFPALQILRQARPPEANLGSILASVEKILESPHWHLRDMAARTVVSLKSIPELYSAGLSLLGNLPKSHNNQHGRLLAVKFMFRKLLQDPAQLALKDFATLMEELSNFAHQWFVVSNCPFIRSTFLDIVGLCGKTMLQRKDTLSILHAWEGLTASISIGPQYALGSSRKNGEALFRASLAQVFFIDRIIVRDHFLSFMVSKEHQSIGNALILLATEDPDTCCAALETLGAAIQIRPSNELTLPCTLILAHIHRIVLDATDLEVISKAQAVLTGGIADNHMKRDFFSLVTKEQVLITLDKLEIQCLDGPPSNAQSALYLLSFFLDFAFHAYQDQRRLVLKSTARYIRLLRMTIIDTNPFDTRFAAVQSIRALEHIWTASTASKSTGPLLLGLSFVLYDMLNDDDDEIRDVAAVAVTDLLRAQGSPQAKHTVPILTTHRLATFLSSTQFTTCRIPLITQSLHRLTCPSSSFSSQNPLFSTPFAELFAQHSKQDTSLFATEKQNLYKDDALDALFWTRVLRSLPSFHATAVPLALHQGLATWVLDGIAVLTQTTKETERDGALGWASKAEVFTLGIQVICASEILLAWSGSIDLEGKESGMVRREILTALRAFADMGAVAEVHGLWIERIERVLEKEVLDALRRVKGSLLTV
ncbi:HEAT repeat protein-like protein [Cucurbitaria berberidis CBS 394.84]|uniref:HEAT repeat protein-like protein n=1 Tax=Cucurbitaria berberidis CBS 394.84 TaxID=1168544 RepID=A0A9P4GLM4_9PLEO|nr:HEAT repeat protein-like protein [Cucurbitaria berberidis CBS 394.84]KAF1847315.1 HEAT repeat protein-like protein [Cucurbitaria berberidis CBS 394.84]